MAKRPTIADLASAAGLGTATVDRALNARGKVREETLRRIVEAADRIGFHASPLLARRSLPVLPEFRLGFLLQKEKQYFYQSFADHIQAAVRDSPGFRGKVSITYAVSQSPADIAGLLRGMVGRVDALAACAVTHPEVTDAVQTLRDAGLPTFALLNDFAQGVRQNYLGTNNLKSGRLAASIISMALREPGPVAVFVGGQRWHGHDLREAGFRSFFREFAPHVPVLDTFVNLETRPLTYEATLHLLRRQPDLRGLYCAGGGMEGMIAALRDERAPGQVALVVNELTPESRSALVDRYATMVIATPLAALCRDLVRFMVDAAQSGPSDLKGQHFLPPDLYLPESF